MVNLPSTDTIQRTPRGGAGQQHFLLTGWIAISIEALEMGDPHIQLRFISKLLKHTTVLVARMFLVNMFRARGWLSLRPFERRRIYCRCDSSIEVF